MRYFVEIENRSGDYYGKVHIGNLDLSREIAPAGLGLYAQLSLSNQAHTLISLVERMLAYRLDDREKLFDERGQLEIGMHLYRQVFLDSHPDSLTREQDGSVEVRIITNDEHAARLPWAMLAHAGIFLSMRGWSVSLARSSRCEDCELPPSPRILIAIPQPPFERDTQARLHLEEIEYALSRANSLHTLGRNLDVAHKWEEFVQKVNEFKPDIVYYYGHGIGSLKTTRLLFTTGSRGERIEVPVADLADCLRRIPDGPPTLAYINCCLGEAGGFLGAGMQLSDFIPAVITNFTVANAEAARAQGLDVLTSILVKAMPPHRAVAEIRHVAGRGQSFSDLRWVTPVAHCSYGEWKFTLPAKAVGPDRHPHWQYMLDRVDQTGQFLVETKKMIKWSRTTRSLGYIWYGGEGQGVDRFYHRAKIELQEFDEINVYEVAPTWPLEFNELHRSAADMLMGAFEVDSLQEIPARVRSEVNHAPGRKALIFVRHEPILDEAIDIETIKRYLIWWDCKFVPLLESNMLAMVGVSFIVSDPEEFKGRATELRRLGDESCGNTVFKILREMSNLEKDDISDFLEFLGVQLPMARRIKVVDEIHGKSGGRYEMVLSQLKRLDELAW